MENNTSEIQVTPYKPYRMGILFLLFIILAFWVGTYNGKLIHQNKTAECINKAESVSEVKVAKAQKGESEYFLQKKAGCENSGEYVCALRLIKVDGDGTSTIILDNIISVLTKQLNTPRLLSGNADLSRIVHINEDRQKIVFMESYPSSSCCGLYTLDLQTLTFTINDYGFGAAAWDSLSPDGSKYLTLGENEKEFLVTDVITDTRQPLSPPVQLNDGESLVKRYGGYGGDPYASVEWSGNNSFYYDVYEEVKVEMGDSLPEEDATWIRSEVHNF